ncbi:hypothetical protein QWJ07_10890 [Frankia sp. RB7]|nr:hypothetical protein [Frankia sp. RB7]
MISLSDSELAAIMAAAAPLQPHARSQFLRDVNAELARYPEIGAGIIHRVVAKIQREHLNPSRLHHHGVSKFGW